MSGTAVLGGVRQEPRSKYLGLALIAAQRAIASPRVVLLHLLASTVWLAVSYHLWGAVFATTSKLGSFDWARMRTYVLVVHGANLLLKASSSVQRMNQLVRTGNISLELLRPQDFMKAQLALCMGTAGVEGGLGALVSCVLGLTFLEVLPPVSVSAAVLGLASLALGFLISFLVGFLVSLLGFWTMNWLGLHWIQSALVGILSGALVPLELYPGWLRSLAMAFPFHGIIHTPLSIYLGDLQGDARLQALGVQGLWAVALWGLARLLWRPALGALRIQGG
jgi:ABC-2 type transport system permease protein